ncbi:MAG: 3-isopropylmalate dehydratase small subunit [Candidatus Brocadiaceae bacterium]|nr:3-isopropylmalate dehydratase small subunit [Candidatus Brocadiaceae bacterium]
MTVEGKCWKFGDDVNTDEIIPARYLNVTDQEELAAHCMEGVDPQFVRKVHLGDIIVAGRNFGCGSSREHAPLAIKACGIHCVVAESFARIFFRNAVNIGLLIAECPEAAREAETGHSMEANFALGRIVNHSTGRNYAFPPFSPELQAIVDAGGLMAFARKEAGG